MLASINIRPKKAIWVTFAIIAGVYAAINLGLANDIGGFFGNHLFQPVLWLILGGAVLLLPRYRTAGKLKDKASVIQLALIVGFFQVVLLVVGGLFASFGKSPYSFTPTGILTNLIFVAAMLFGMEFSSCRCAPRGRRNGHAGDAVWGSGGDHRCQPLLDERLSQSTG